MTLVLDIPVVLVGSAFQEFRINPSLVSNPAECGHLYADLMQHGIPKQRGQGVEMMDYDKVTAGSSSTCLEITR